MCNKVKVQKMKKLKKAIMRCTCYSSSETLDSVSRRVSKAIFLTDNHCRPIIECEQEGGFA